MNTLLIEIPGTPIAKKRPRFFRRGKFMGVYNAQTTEEGKFICLMQSQLNGHKPIPKETPVRIKLTFYMPIPASMPKKTIAACPEHTKKPDLDNMIKFVKDCANEVLWHDDSQVIHIEAYKCYSHNPMTSIYVAWDENNGG
jgi:Holliday junction resolvase RusA-like endonuclease